jgi:hypothetical protein
MIWPRAGIVSTGVAYRQPKWERRISEIGSGLWVTATASDAMRVKFKVDSIRKVFSRPGATGPNGLFEDVVAHIGEYPTMNFIQHVMGFPTDWTKLEPLAMDKFQQWLRQHGDY